MAPRLLNLEDHVWVSGWIDPSEAPALAAAGVRSIVNHRPDHEEPDQATAQAWAVAAEAAGIRYRHAPIAGLPGDAAVLGTQAALDEQANGEQLLLFCRSGMRSTAAWAMARVAAGSDRQTIRDLALAAGYDLSRLPL